MNRGLLSVTNDLGIPLAAILMKYCINANLEIKIEFAVIVLNKIESN